MKKLTWLAFVLSVAALVPLAAEGQQETLGTGSPVSGTLTMFHAGSLAVPFAAMEEKFEELYPGVDLQREAAGSTKCARKITDLHKPCDIMASADYTVIDKLLIPAYADWNVRFATNQMVLCYTDSSAYAKRIGPENWYQILLEKDVVWGHSDPNLDPCGYRSLMVLQLAEQYYNQPGLYEQLLANRPLENVRPKSVDLISLLQTGNMDYAWEYLSVAVQHGLNYITLPPELNLGDYRFDDVYARAVVQVSGTEPGSFMEMRGKSITYGVTLLKKAPNPEAAVAFLRYMLDPGGGLQILDDQGQPAFRPARVPAAEMKVLVPAALQPLLEVRD